MNFLSLSLCRANGILLGVFLCVSPIHAAPPSAAREWNEELLAAIRVNVPNPPAHARNLFHTALAMYNAWAAYDSVAVGYIYNEKMPQPPAEVELARREAISYAAYRVLRNRFATGAGAATTMARLDSRLTAMGYSTAIAQAALTAGNSPPEIGKRIGQAILAWGNSDGFSRIDFPLVYDYTVNSNMTVPLHVLGTNSVSQSNVPLGYGIPRNTDPNYWQPLALSSSISQNGIPMPGGVQSFVGVQGLAVTPFSLTRTDNTKPWIDLHGGPTRISTPTIQVSTDAAYKDQAMGVLRAGADLNDQSLIDISPGSIGNSMLGTDNGQGYPQNAITGMPFPANRVKKGDFARVLAEYWADGPNSETPPGHWHILANQVSDHTAFVKKIRGAGPLLNDLEWDVKMYFALSAATHDAACAAWSLKRYYSGTRPITMIRYLADKGQCSDPSGLSYHPQGIPLENGVTEMITEITTASGGKHEQIWDLAIGGYRAGAIFTGQVAVYGWPGEHPGNAPAPATALNQNNLRWMLAKDWLPFQRKTFNTPAFPGYISGHSCFSRAAAEVLTLLSGSSYFPGGFQHHRVAANSLQMDKGPSADIDLQWSSYFDAADQAGQSRRWGGIHVAEDDFHGRETGAIVGKLAFGLAEKYWTGTISREIIQPVIVMETGGSVSVSWNSLRGMYYKVQSNIDLSLPWTDATAFAAAYDSKMTFLDAAPSVNRKFYRILRGTIPTP